ncbi:Hypothetical predicted protein [Paramuricea clavata]|uniref:Uncharacterized protein n=1 Tax=Paramuricea clavata TaxID=317549 RepID=A0A6S7GQU1_PARCT|nr:Hypothetical predicted protein [Paramuricea clavata]
MAEILFLAILTAIYEYFSTSLSAVVTWKIHESYCLAHFFSFHLSRFEDVYGIYDTSQKYYKVDRIINEVNNLKLDFGDGVCPMMKDHNKAFEDSSANRIQSLNVLYSSKPLSKEQYKSICSSLATHSSSKNNARAGLQFMPETNLPKLLIKYVNLIDIGNLKYIKEELCDDLEDDMKVDGAYRELEDFLKELASMYIKIDQQLGELSREIDQRLHPFWKLAIPLQSSHWGRRCPFQQGANCSESHISMIRYCQTLMAEIGNIENQVYYLPGDGGQNFQVKLHLTWYHQI